MDLEHHQLILRYEHLRVRCPERERRLLAALAGHGQQMPIVVVAAEETERFVVVDGYKRIRAMRRLGCDVIRAACWDLEEADALLLGRLMRTAETETAFEQGLWLREMHLHSVHHAESSDPRARASLDHQGSTSANDQRDTAAAANMDSALTERGQRNGTLWSSVPSCRQRLRMDSSVLGPSGCHD